MIFTQVIWSLEHSGTFVPSVVFNADSLAERDLVRPIMKMLFMWLASFAGIWTDLAHAVWWGYDGWKGLQHGVEEAPLTTRFVLGAKAKDTRISPAQVKAGYKADVSESFRQVTTSGATCLFRRFQGSKSSDPISVPVSQSLIQPVSQHHSSFSLSQQLSGAIGVSKFLQLLVTEAVSNSASGSSPFGKFSGWGLDTLGQTLQSVIHPQVCLFFQTSTRSLWRHSEDAFYFSRGWDLFYKSTDLCVWNDTGPLKLV